MNELMEDVLLVGLSQTILSAVGNSKFKGEEARALIEWLVVDFGKIYEIDNDGLAVLRTLVEKKLK